MSNPTASPVERTLTLYRNDPDGYVIIATEVGLRCVCVRQAACYRGDPSIPVVVRLEDARGNRLPLEMVRPCTSTDPAHVHTHRVQVTEAPMPHTCPGIEPCAACVSDHASQLVQEGSFANRRDALIDIYRELRIARNGRR